MTIKLLKRGSYKTLSEFDFVILLFLQTFITLSFQIQKKSIHELHY